MGLSLRPPQSGLAWPCFLFPLIEPDWQISRILLALTPTENLVINVMSMNKECSEDELVICPWPSGPYFSPNTISGSSIGRRSKPTKPASTPTFIRNPIKQEVL